MFTKEQALTTSAIHYDKGLRGPGKSCAVWHRNGKTQTWKRSPERFRLPTKFGLYQYHSFTEHDADSACYHTAEDCPYA